MKLKQFFAGVLTAVLVVGSLAAKAEIAAESEEGFLDLTIGDRAAKDTEALVVDPTWGDVDAAELLIDGEESARTYTAASIDAWETAVLEPGRYVVALEAGELVEQAAFWKLGEDWVVLDNETITENVTFESGKTYLVFGTNLIASGVTLTVTDGAKFFYDESAPAGFQTAGGSLNELPKRYKIADGLDPADETEFYQIVEKIHGCEDNPWSVGAEGEVAAWTNGTELVMTGAGKVGALNENAELALLLEGLTAITIVDGEVTVDADTFAGLDEEAFVALTLPDGWQGDFPDDEGKWYGARVELTALPFTIRNVVFAQRWPWNGMVDVAFDLTGSEGEQNLIVKVRDGETEIANFNTTVTIPVDGVVNGVRVVWNAAAADLDANFRSNDITIEVVKTTLADGQLWEGGPIWSDCNIGAVKPGDYGDLVDGDAAAGAVTAAFGEGWRLPTGDEITALIANSSTNWVTCENSEGNSVYGCLFTSKVDLSKSVFVPCAGTDRSDGKGRVEDGANSYNWSSTLLGKRSAWYLRLAQDDPTLPPIASLSAGTRDNKMSVRAVRDAESPVKSIVKGTSIAGMVDLRANIALVEGETTVSNVMWSATAWGELDESFTTVGYTNLTTGATGEFGNLANIMGAGLKDVVLPQKDGDYQLTHTQGGLVSFATFTVTGYPLGSMTNPWKIGAGDDPASVTAVRDGDGIVVNPVRGVATREGLETIVEALGGTEFPVGLVSADGTATNDLVLLVGSDGKGFQSLADALASDADSFMLYEIPGPTVSLPAGLEGLTLVVSNLTDGVEIPVVSSVPGGADYVLPYGACIGVYAVPAEDYELVDGTNPIMVDEVTFETTVDASVLPTAANLTVAKDAAKAAIDETLGEEPSEEVLALADAAKAAIDEATTLADIATAQQDGLDTIVVQKQFEAALAEAKETAKAAIDEALGEEPSEDVLALADAAKAAIEAAVTLDDVATAQQDGLDAITAQQQSEVALAEAKEAAKVAIDEVLGEEPSEAVLTLADAAKAAIEAAATLDDVATAQQDGLDAIAAQQQDEAEAAAALAAAKDEAKTAVEDALGEEPSEEVLALAEAAKAAIDAAATLDDVAQVLADGLAAIAEQQAAEEKRAQEEAELAAAKADAIAEVQSAAGPEEERSEAVEALVDAARGDVMAAESQEALSAVLDDALTAIAAQLAADAKRKAEYLYPEGDGAFVAPKKATQYLGSFVTVDGKVNGTVLVKMTKPGNKTGLANIAATITTLDRKSLIFKAKKVDVAGSTDGVFVLAPVNVRAKEMGDLSIVISGDSLMGTLPNGQGVDAARNVFKDRKDPKCGRIAPFVGDWTLALDVDGGLLPLTMRVANSGSVRLSGKFASGKTFSASVNSVVGDGWICAPVAVVKASDGKNVEVAFAVAFREGTGTIEIVRSSNIELVAVGKPVSDKKSIKAKTVAVEGMGAPVKQSVNFAANTGKLTGSAQWKDGNKSVKAKLFGVEIDGVVYGNAVINKTSHPFTLQ